MRRVLVLASAVLLIGSFAALVFSVRSGAASEGESLTAGLQIPIELPNRPPVWELYPELFDKDGCQRVPADEGGGKRCGLSSPLQNNSPPDAAGAQPSAADTYRVLRGFAGPHFATVVRGNGVSVLEDSLATTSNGTWQAWGLARNELTHAVSGLEITASLYSESSKLLERVSAKVPVGVLRPGEPGPFHIRASVETRDVARVEWSVNYDNAVNLISRDILIQPYWQLPYGEAQYRGIQRDDAPYPYVLAAGLRNVGKPINGATLVIAWLDEGNRVIWVETSPLHADAIRNIPANGTSHFDEVRVLDPEVGPKLYDLTKMYWVVGE